jgi:hypothetical protein
MKAKVVYYDPISDVEQIEVNSHNIQFGGAGDGYCYTHQSFTCCDNLSEKEWNAIENAEGSDPA